MMVFAHLLSRCLSTVTQTQGLNSPPIPSRRLTADSGEGTGEGAMGRGRGVGADLFSAARRHYDKYIHGGEPSLSHLKCVLTG